MEKVGLPEGQCYILDQNYTSFILKSNTIFVKLLQSRMEFKWSYIDEPRPIEIEWYVKLFNVQDSKKTTNELRQIREYNFKRKTVQQENEWYEKLSEYDNEIYENYHKLSNESNKLDAMPGFVDTILSFVCPTNLMESIQLDVFLMDVY